MYKDPKKVLLGVFLFILFAALSACVTFSVVYGGNSAANLPADIGLFHNSFMATLALWFLASIPMIVFAFLIVFATYVLGKFACGYLSGYRLLFMHVCTWGLAMTDRGVKIRRCLANIRTAECFMQVPEDRNKDDIPLVWYHTGGVMALLLIVTVAVLFVRFVPLAFSMRVLFLGITYIGIYCVFVFGLLDFSGLYSMMKRDEWRQVNTIVTQMTGRSLRGEKSSDLIPREWADADCNDVLNGQMNKVKLLCVADELEGENRMEEAYGILQRLADSAVTSDAVIMEAEKGRLYFAIILNHDLKDIEPMFTEDLLRYLRMYRKVYAASCSLLYFYELVFANNYTGAQRLRRRLEKKNNLFLISLNDNDKQIIALADKVFEQRQ